MRPRLLSTALVLLLALGGARAGEPRFVSPPPRTELLVSPAWLGRHLGSPELVLVHVGRDRAVYERGHLPGARYLDLDELVASRRGLEYELPPLATLVALVRELGITESSRVIVYDDDSGVLAARLFFTLDYLGHGDRTALLDGHLVRWKREGRRLVEHVPDVRPSGFLPRLRPEVRADLPLARDLVWQAANQPAAPVVVYDARHRLQYTGVQPGPEGSARRGHIRGARNVHWKNTLVRADDPTLRPLAQLRRLYRMADVHPDAHLMTYCNTGAKGSHAYFVLCYLGYRPLLYDGSFQEWSRLADMPLAEGIWYR